MSFHISQAIILFEKHKTIACSKALVALLIAIRIAVHRNSCNWIVKLFFTLSLGNVYYSE